MTFSVADYIFQILSNIVSGILLTLFLTYKTVVFGSKRDKVIYGIVMSAILSMVFVCLSFGVYHFGIYILKWQNITSLEPSDNIAGTFSGYLNFLWFIDYYFYLLSFSVAAILIFLSMLTFGPRHFWKNFYVLCKKVTLILIGFIIAAGLENIISTNVKLVPWQFCLIRIALSIIRYSICFLVYSSVLYTEEKYYESQSERDWLTNAITLAVLIFATFISLLCSNNRLIYHSDDVWEIVMRVGIMASCVIASLLFVVKQRKLLILSYNDRNSLNKYNSIDEQVQFLNDQLQQTKDDIESVRRYRHDLRHHLLLLDGLMQRGEFSEAKKYIKELSNQTETLLPTQYCSNVYVNSILSAYAKKAKDQNIELLIKTAVPSNINFDDVELSTLFANLFENAIEACKYLNEKQKKYIIINCEHKRSNLVILVENPCRDNITFRDGLPQTNKEHGGRGTSIVKQIVENHHGLIQYNAINKVFSVKIIVSAPRT
jgi:signal transduction histidine kinase